MPKDTKTLGNSKARACESLGFVHKKGCARVLTQPRTPAYITPPKKVNLKVYHQWLEDGTYLLRF